MVKKEKVEVLLNLMAMFITKDMKPGCAYAMAELKIN